MKVRKKALTLGAEFTELAVDDEGVSVGGAGGQATRGEEGEERLPGDGGGNEIDSSANEVAVELQGRGLQSERPRHGTEVQHLIVQSHARRQLRQRRAEQLHDFLPLS